MPDTRIVLTGMWIAVMLTYLLGDVLRIFAGHFEEAKIAGEVPTSQGMWMLIAVIMLTPILMTVFNLTLPYPAIRWVNIIAAVLWPLFGSETIRY